MKKIFATLLASTMMLGLAACGGGNSSGGSGGQSSLPQGSAAPEFKMTVGSTVQDDSASGVALLEYFKPYIEEQSGGRIQVEVQNNSVLGGDRELYEALQLNTVQGSFGPMSTLANFEPNYAVCDLPFLFNGKDDAYAQLDGEFGAKLAENLPNIGMRLLAYGENAFRNISNSVRPINTLEDIKGMKIRVMESPVNIATYTALGCNPTPMAFSELYTGLQQGAVEGQDNGIVLTYTSKLYEVQKYYTYTGHIYAANGVVLSEAFWKTLPEDLQKVVDAGAKYAMENQRRLNTEMEETLEKTMSDAGVQFNRLSEDELNRFREAAKSVWEQDGIKSLMDPEIYEMAVAIRDN
ncbi:TRAP transporter substrate-binding protein [Oscillibacter sp. GMB15532]|uniref:TRAP transporter substrate-binding protein n=1 Tax=Oscillibacter sp. GMB15532 TaxID=3230022 RepID=UPI0034DE32A2